MVITTLESSIRGVGLWQVLVAIAAMLFFLLTGLTAFLKPTDARTARAISITVSVAALIVGVALLIDLFQ